MTNIYWVVVDTMPLNDILVPAIQEFEDHGSSDSLKKLLWAIARDFDRIGKRTNLGLLGKVTFSSTLHG